MIKPLMSLDPTHLGKDLWNANTAHRNAPLKSVIHVYHHVTWSSTLLGHQDLLSAGAHPVPAFANHTGILPPSLSLPSFLPPSHSLPYHSSPAISNHRHSHFTRELPPTPSFFPAQFPKETGLHGNSNPRST